MLNRKAVRLFAIIIVLSLLCTSSVFASTTDNTVTITRPIDWLSTCETYTEMEANADLIVYGTVASQRTIIRCDVVFTISAFNISHIYKGEALSASIDVIQTGGETATLVTPVPSNGPLLEPTQAAYLYLKYVEATDYDDDYYLIIGGQQGSYSLSSRNSCLEWYELQNYASENFKFVSSGSSARTSQELLGGSWPQDTVVFKVDMASPGSSTPPTTTFVYQIISSFLVWNNSSDEADIDFLDATFSSDPYYDVKIVCINFNGADWGLSSTIEGRTVNNPQYNATYTSATVRLNTEVFDESYANWPNIITHEAGHVLGLGDLSVGYVPNYSSVMIVSSSHRAETPTDYDRGNLADVY